MARALAWHARGHRFEPDILHYWIKGDSVFHSLFPNEIFDILTHETVE